MMSMPSNGGRVITRIRNNLRHNGRDPRSISTKHQYTKATSRPEVNGQSSEVAYQTKLVDYNAGVDKT